MKWYTIPALAILATISQLFSCADLTGGLDDQSPVLFVDIVNNNSTYAIGPYVAGTSCPAYLVYYTNSNWTNPWLQQKSTTGSFTNPVVGMLSIYIMAFLDTNNNGVVDAGEPCTGYNNIDFHAVAPANELTKLEFMPLEWKSITITIGDAPVY
jgi:hypothetical protein